MNTNRVDRAERVIPASVDDVFSALIDAAALTSWLPPETMTAEIGHFNARVGGGFRMVLRYPANALDEAGAGPGKASELEDIVDVTYTVLHPGSKVEWEAIFETTDPTLAGVMTQTWMLEPVDDDRPSTRVVIEARDVPMGITAVDHEAGLNESLAQLADWVVSTQ